MCNNTTCENVTKRQCIQTFSASQLSTVAVLILFLIQYVRSEYTLTPTLSWIVNGSVFLSIIYFVVGSWVIEERYIWKLRNLRAPFRQAEFLIRLLAMVTLYVGIGSSSINQTPGDFPTSIAVTLMGLGYLYYLWDVVVYFGSGKVPVMVHADFCIIVASFLWAMCGVGLAGSADVGGYVLALSTLAFVVPLGILYRQERRVIIDFLHRYRRNRVR